MRSDAPLFIIGNPRSGTTLLRLMLTHHSNITIPPECGFALWLYPTYKNWSTASTSEIDGFIDDLCNARKFETWGLNKKSIRKNIEEQCPETYTDLVSLVYKCYAEKMGKPQSRWGDKNNYYLREIPKIKLLFPSTYFIHIIRDCRDVACSYLELANKNITHKYAPQLPDDIESIASEWKDNINTIRESFDQFKRENVVEVRFEDLILKPEETLEFICKGIGEKYESKMLDYHKEDSRVFEEPMEFLSWKEKVVQSPGTTCVGRYRNDLKKQDLDAIEQICGELMQQYGY